MDTALHFSFFKNRKLHLGVCGSIAAYKAVDLMRFFQKTGMHVSVTLTKAATEFITPLTFEALGANLVLTEMFGQDTGTSFAHLLPESIAETFVIAPTSASTLAKMATGQADTLLSAQCLAYAGPLVIAPAMNPKMWSHPATVANKKVLEKRGVFFIEPSSGHVACGDIGAGKLAEIQDIYWTTLKTLAPQDMQGKKVMVTLGPTKEKWDGVRYWTNPSTGHMGKCLAIASWLRGAKVYVISGIPSLTLPPGIVFYPTLSAKDMYEAANTLWDEMDIGIFTAAVADFSPIPFGQEKFKKASSPDGFSISFIPNSDILQILGKRKSANQKILGFAAETSNLEESVQKKLVSKNADLIAGNYIGVKNSGFGSETNNMLIMDRNGKLVIESGIRKTDAAWRLLDWLLTL